MRHLTIESLARLVDESPAPAEVEHLESCEECRRELDALREQSAALAGLPDRAPPAHAWPRLDARLRREGLVHPGSSDTARRLRPWTPLMRMAAAIALFLLGGATGFAARDLATTGAAGDAAVSSTLRAGAGDASQRTTDAFAIADLEEAERAYLAALARYGELPELYDAGDPVARLAALQGIVLTTREALRQAPADPVINGYHLTAVAQRDAMLQRLALDGDDPWF